MNYGTICRELWESPEFGDLTPEEKFFVLWTLTAPQAKMCGCWLLNSRISAAETGFNDETIHKLVARLREEGWLQYDIQTREILINSWAQRNVGLFRAAAPGKKPNSAREKIITEAHNIRSARFRVIVFQWLSDGEIDPPLTTRLPPVDGGGNITNTQTILHETVTTHPNIFSLAARSSSPSVSPSSDRIPAIPDQVMDLLPQSKRTSRHLAIVSAAILNNGVEIVRDSIRLAITKAKGPNPWGMIIVMLQDMVDGADWYLEERTKEAVLTSKQEAASRQQEQENTTRQQKHKSQLQRQIQLTRLMESLSGDDKIEIESAAMQACERIGASFSSDMLHAAAINILGERYPLTTSSDESAYRRV